MDEELYKQIDIIILTLINRGVVTENKESTSLHSEAIRFLKSKNFIKETRQRFQYEASSEIFDIKKVGGIEEYLKQNENNDSIELKIKDLTVRNLDLQNEAYEYQRKIRDKETQIRKLTSDNLRLNNWDIRFRWVIAFITFIIGFITKYYIDK